MNKIGIFGGSFDPVHYGHLRLAEAAVKEVALNRIIFLPAFIPPHKHVLTATAGQRLAMLRAAIKGKKKFSISRYEIKKRKPVFTGDSIAYFKKLYARSLVFFLIGGDSLKDMHAWESGYHLLSRCAFIVGIRPGVAVPNRIAEHNVMALKTKMPDISATDIRCRIKSGRPVALLIPDAVAGYIAGKRLYAE